MLEYIFTEGMLNATLLYWRFEHYRAFQILAAILAAKHQEVVI